MNLSLSTKPHHTLNPGAIEVLHAELNSALADSIALKLQAEQLPLERVPHEI